MKRTIKIKRCIPFQPKQVWQAITDPKLLGDWFMENDIELKLNHEFTFRKDPQPGWNGITYCRIIKIENERHIAFTYKGEASGEKTLACAGIHSEVAANSVKGIFTKLDTILSFTLIPDCNGTCIVIQQSGFNGIKLILVSYVMQMGWKKLINKLNLTLKKIDKENLYK